MYENSLMTAHLKCHKKRDQKRSKYKKIIFVCLKEEKYGKVIVGYNYSWSSRHIMKVDHDFRLFKS